MKRKFLEYASQNDGSGSTPNQAGGDNATYNTSKLRPEQDNNISGASVAGTDNAGRSSGQTPDMDADNATPGTGDMSGRTGDSPGHDTVTGG